MATPNQPGARDRRRLRREIMMAKLATGAAAGPPAALGPAEGGAHTASNQAAMSAPLGGEDTLDGWIANT